MSRLISFLRKAHRWTASLATVSKFDKFFQFAETVGDQITYARPSDVFHIFPRNRVQRRIRRSLEVFFSSELEPRARVLVTSLSLSPFPSLSFSLTHLLYVHICVASFLVCLLLRLFSMRAPTRF